MPPLVSNTDLDADAETVMPFLQPQHLPRIKPLLSRFNADSLIALNDALRFTPEAKLRDVLRSVCLSNLNVAVVLHGVLCGGYVEGSSDAGASAQRIGMEGNVVIGEGDISEADDDEDDDDEDDDDDGKAPLSPETGTETIEDDEESSNGDSEIAVEDWDFQRKCPMGFYDEGPKDTDSDDDDEDEEEEEGYGYAKGNKYGTEFSPRDSDVNVPFDDWDIYEYNHQLMDEDCNEEDEDEEEDESGQDNETKKCIVNHTNDANVPVLDLTEPDADKENANPEQNANQGQKRKVSDDDIEFLYSKKAKHDLNSSAQLSSTSYAQCIGPMERWIPCSNCSKQFDRTAVPCHDHKAGPRRAPATRDRACRDKITPGDTPNDEVGDEHESLEYRCDCTYHPGKLRALSDSIGWAGDDLPLPILGNMQS